MKKTVDFMNTKGPVLYATLRNLEEKDLIAPTPEVFNTDYDGHAILSLADVIAMIFPNGDVNEKPMIYIRHTDMIKKQFRFGNLVDLGDDFLSPQKGVFHQDEVAQAGTAITDYHKVSEGVYGFECERPTAEFRFFENGFSVKEGNFLSLTVDKWPLAIFEHKSMYNHVSTIIQAGSFRGIFEGKPCLGVGEHDRLFIPTEVNGFDGITNDFGYFYMNMIGIREDGRREQALISIGHDQKILAYYYIDGETPIMCDHVSMETEWHHLPYVNDGTCVYKDATFRFAGKELHFEGKWGSKGFTPKPRVEKHGQSQIFGTWYEGKTPYRHRLYMTFGENMEAYDYKLEKMGFVVVD
jgi:hypothetical protein